MKQRWIKKLIITIIVCFVGILITDMTYLLSLRAYIFNHESSSQNAGEQLDIDLSKLHAIDNGYGDWLVHPCVRYISEGLNGHKWWMAVTPYPDHNSRYEQPVLYYGEGNDTIPPKKWNYVGLVTNWHHTGYNADPNLFWWKNKLWIIWKESKTENTSTNCIMMCSYDGKRFSTPRKILEQRDSVHVGLTAPTLLMIGDSIKLLATDFEHVRNDESKQPFGRNRLAIWTLNNNNLENGIFTFQRAVNQEYPSDFNYWHAEMIRSESGIYYSVVTPESGDRILLGVSSDGEHYQYEHTPLLSRNGNLLSNMYKASIVEVGRSIYMFYPAASGFGHKKSHIYVTKIDL